MASSELKQIFEHAKSDRSAAYKQLVSYVKANPTDEQGWLLMGRIAGDAATRKKSLERALQINPDFEPAQQALAKMNGSNGNGTAATVTDPPQKRKNAGQMVYEYPLKMRFKIVALAPQIIITDANDHPVLYVRQKILNLREDVRIFRDESKVDELFRINANKIIDIGARYAFTDSKSEMPLGAIKQRGLKTIWKAHYDIETDNPGSVTHILTEDNPWVKVADALVSEIPFVGLLTGYILQPSYTIKDMDDRPVMHLKKMPSFFGRFFTIDIADETISVEEEKRLLLSMMMMVQLNRGRG